MAEFETTSEDIFDDVFFSNYSSSLASLIDSNDESYLFIHVCLPFNVALIVTFTIAGLIQLITCVGIYKTSHQIITSVFYHFKINEKAEKIKNEWYKFKETLEKENDTTDTKLEMCLVLNTSSSNDINAILGADIESNNINCRRIDMNDHELDHDCEEHRFFQDMINEHKITEFEPRYHDLIRAWFFMVGIDASVNAIQDKIQQVIAIERQQLPKISGMQYNPWNGQIQLQVDFSLDRYIKRAKLTDYQRELMQKWLTFVTFANILALAVMIRMIFRVILIFWLLFWSIHNANINGQSVWDSLFFNLIMTPIAWIIWQVDFLVLNHIIIQYRTLQKLNDVMKFAFFTKDGDRDAMNPLMIKRCKCLGCDKTWGFLTWYFFLCCLVAIVMSAALAHETKKMGGNNDTAIGMWWACVLLGSCYCPCWMNKIGGMPVSVRWMPWLIPMQIAMFIVASVVLWTIALHNGVKYDTICDNYDQSDAYGSWSYLMWVIL